MNELRIVLLVAGAVAVAALYFWEAGRDRRQQRRRTLMTAPGTDTVSVRTRPEAPESDGTGLAGALAGLGLSLRREREPIAGSGGGRHQVLPEPERIVTLHVVATDAPFAGPEILAAADAAGLRHGPMRIFHRFDAGGMEYETPLFSLASMREPGHIELEGIDDFRTSGLSLFMCVPVPAGDHLVFDLMLRTAEQLAKSLNGELCGPDHGRLDPGRLAALRARLSA